MGKKLAPSKGGPKTEAGKAIASANATKHGIMSIRPVIDGEDPSAWEAHLRGTIEALEPVGHLERVLAERVALLLWRQLRVARHETIVLDHAVAATADDMAKAWRDFPLLSNAPRLALHPNDLIERAQDLERVHAALEALPDQSLRKRVEASVAAGTIFAVWEQTSEMAADWEEIEWTGIPPDIAGELETYDRWTVGKVCQCIEQLAALEGVPAGQLIQAALKYLTGEVVRARAEADRIRRELSKRAAERSMPSEVELSKIVRYESHLNRQMQVALRELEALQKRRVGESAPLARIDVSGLS